MNKTHGHYAIPNDDFLFVLWTFIEFPIRWTDSHGRRRMTAHEQVAWFNFWVGIGERMGLKDIPADKAAFDAFIRQYEAQHFLPAEASQRVADATVRIMANWFPAFLQPWVKPVVRCVMPAQFLQAVGYPPAPAWARTVVGFGLRLVGRVNRVLPFGSYPRRVATRKERTYHDGYRIEELQPVHLSRQEAARGRAGEAREL